MEIPGFLIVHEAVVRRYLGMTGNGPRFGPGEVVPCFRDDARRLVRGKDNTEMLSTCTLYCQLSIAEIPVESEVDILGRTATVISTKRRDGGDLPTPDHWEVSLT